MEILKQNENAPLRVEQQVAILFALNEGFLDEIDISDVSKWETEFHGFMSSNHADILDTIS